MNCSHLAVLTIAGTLALAGTSCLEEDETNGDSYLDGYMIEGRATVMGSVAVDPDIAPLDDGHGSVCIGLYDADLACPPTGSVEYRRQVGFFFVDTDINTMGEVPFVIHNVIPGSYQVGVMFDADQNGCYEQVNAGDSMGTNCLEFTVEADEIIDLDPVLINYELAQQ